MELTPEYEQQLREQSEKEFLDAVMNNNVAEKLAEAVTNTLQMLWDVAKPLYEMQFGLEYALSTIEDLSEYTTPNTQDGELLSLEEKLNEYIRLAKLNKDMAEGIPSGDTTHTAFARKESVRFYQNGLQMRKKLNKIKKAQKKGM